MWIVNQGLQAFEENLKYEMKQNKTKKHGKTKTK